MENGSKMVKPIKKEKFTKFILKLDGQSYLFSFVNRN